MSDGAYGRVAPPFIIADRRRIPSVTAIEARPTQLRIRIPPSVTASPLDVVVRLTTAVGTASTLPQIYDAALEGLRDAFGVERASIRLFDPDGVLRFKAWRGISDAYRAAVESHTPWRPGQPAPDPMVVRDVRVDTLLAVDAPTFVAEEIVGLAFVPLIAEGRTIGGFMLYERSPHDFPPDQLKVAVAIGYLIGFAVERMLRLDENRRLYSETQRLLGQEATIRERLATLTDDSQGLLTSLSSASIVEEVLALASRVIVADAYAMWRRDGNEWYIAGSRGLGHEFAAIRVSWPGTFDFRDPIVAADLETHPLLSARMSDYAREGIRSLVSVPLAVRSETAGTIAFYHRTRHVPSEGELKIAGALGHLAAAAITNVELYDEQRALASENARLFREAQAANRLKDEFLATLSHELRTPLNVVLGRLQMLRMTSDPATVKPLLDSLDRNSTMLARLVDDLLDVSRMTVGQVKLDRQPVDLAAAVDAAMQAVQPAAEAKQLAITIDAPTDLPRLVGDLTRLQQIVWNLLTNAVKFTPAGGTITIRLRAADQMLSIAVIDSGEGISAEALPHLFDMFWQAEPTTSRRFGGLGLGLSIVRRLVELHGGDVSVQSAGLGHGATFVVRLPTSSTPAAV
jgi:signal transduction histidine kinase